MFYCLDQKIISRHIENNDFAEAVKHISSLAKNKEFYSDPHIASELRKAVAQILERLSRSSKSQTIFKLSSQLLVDCNPLNIYKDCPGEWFGPLAASLERAISERDCLAYELLESALGAFQEVDSSLITQNILSRITVCLGTALFKSMGERPFSANLKDLLLKGHEKLLKHMNYHKLGIEICSLILGLNNHKIEMACMKQDSSVMFHAVGRTLAQGIVGKENAETVHNVLCLANQKQWRLPKASISLKVNIYVAFLECCISKINFEKASFWWQQLQAFNPEDYSSSQQNRVNSLYLQLLRKMGKLLEELQFVRKHLPENLLSHINDFDSFKTLCQGLKDKNLIALAYQELFLGAMALEQTQKNPDLILKLYIIRMELEKHLDAASIVNFHYAVDGQLAKLLSTFGDGLEASSKVLDIALESIKAFVVDFINLDKDGKAPKDSKEKFAGTILEQLELILPIVSALEPANRGMLVKQVTSILDYDGLVWEDPVSILRLLPFLNVFSQEGISEKAGDLLLGLLNEFPEKLTHNDILRISALKNKILCTLELADLF